MVYLVFRALGPLFLKVLLLIVLVAVSIFLRLNTDLEAVAVRALAFASRGVMVGVALLYS